jgi:hypothetical protein
MKSKILLLLLSIILTGELLQAQQLPADSIKMVKHQQRIAEITKQLEDRKQKLAGLELELLDKTSTKQKAIEEAQESADKNRQAAVTLSNDAQDRRKAKSAERSSDEARRDAKKARRASNNLEELESDIKLLKKRISEDEKKLADLIQEKIE